MGLSIEMNNQQRGYFEDNKEKIIKQIDSAIEEWKRQEIEWPTDRSEDIEYTLNIRKLVTEGTWDEAVEMAHSMDSEPREMLPYQFWHFE